MPVDLGTAVAKLRLDTGEFNTSLNTSQHKIISAGATMAKGLGIATAAAGAGMIKFGKDSVEAGKQFDKSMSQVAATMGFTLDEIETQVGSTDTAFGHFEGTLRDFAQFMGANTAFSATEAADALNYMALAGYDAQTSMEMLPNVLNLASAGGFDLARASDMITDTQTAFGISLERTTQMVDEMAKAASSGNTSVEQLGDAFLVVGGLAQELNGGLITLDDGTQKSVDGIQELEIALTAMANSGIKGSEAGTHMRNMLLKLANPTTEGASALDKLGVAVFDDEGKMRSLNNIFGDLTNALNGDVTPALTEFYEKFSGMSDEAILKEFEKAPEDFDYFGLSVVDAEGKLKDFNTVLAESKEKFSEGITQEGKLSVISDLFNTRDLASAEAILNSINQDWDDLGEKILDAQGSAQKMADTQLDNLSGDITLFKSALEGAKITVSDRLTPTLRKFVKFGTKEIGKLDSAFKNGGIAGLANQMGKSLGEATKMIIKEVPTFVSSAATLAISFIGALADEIPKQFPVLLSSFLETVDKLARGLIDQVPNIMGGIGSIIGDVISNIPNILELGLNIIAGLGQGIIEGLPKIAKGIWEGIKGLFSGPIDSDTALARQKIKDLNNEISNVGSVTDEMAQAFRDADKDAKLAEHWVEIYEDLNNKETLTKDEQIKLNKAVEELQKIFPELGQAVQDETGHWNLNTQAIKDNIQAMKGAARAKVYYAKVEEDMARIVELEEQLTEEQNALNALNEEKTSRNLEALVSNYESLISQMQKVSNSGGALLDQWNKGTDAMRDYAESVGLGGDNFYGWDAVIAAATEDLIPLNSELDKLNSKIKDQEEVVDKTQDAIDAYNDAIDGYINKAIEAESTTENVTDAIDDAKDAASETAEVVEDELDKLPTEAEKAAWQTAEGYARGMKAKEYVMKQAMAHAAEAAKNEMKKRLQIASPSKYMRWIGQMVGEGERLGILDEIPKIKKASAEAADAAGIDAISLGDRRSQMIINGSNSYRSYKSSKGETKADVLNETALLILDEVKKFQNMALDVDGKRLVGTIIREVDRQLAVESRR